MVRKTTKSGLLRIQTKSIPYKSSITYILTSVCSVPRPFALCVPDVIDLTIMDILPIQTKAEQLYLRQIAKGIRQGTLTKVHAQYMAKAMLAVEPFTSWDDLLTKMRLLTQHFPNFQPVVDQLASEYEETKTQSVVEEMSKHLHAGDIDQALSVAQGV